jgi:hypothetical protein
LAKAPTRKLKVFQAQFGFYDTVVAASSKAAALRAWGIHQDIFASGQARPTDEPQAVEAALAHPETPLKRAVGSTDPFALEAALPDVPEAPKKPAAKAMRKAKPEPPPRPKADRSALAAAEAALQKLDEARKREEAEFRRRQEELDAQKAAAQAAYVGARKAATAAVVAARQAYREAGGED